MKLKKNICILLTAAIKPNNVPNLKRTDPKNREKDYIDSLHKWTSLGINLVFVENTNYDSPEIYSLLDNNQCEYLKYTSHIGNTGKGYGEAEIMRFAIKHSKYISQSDIIVKATGRYFISNLNKILREVENKEEWDIVAILKRDLKFADSRMFICKKRFLTEHFEYYYDDINEEKGIFFEHALARAIHSCMSKGGTLMLPNQMPIFEGVSGTEGLPYNNSILRLIKRNVLLKLSKLLISLDY